jgi:hypothetical protein
LFSWRAIFRRYAGSDRYRAAWMVRRNVPHSFSAAARVFCREEAGDHDLGLADVDAGDPLGEQRLVFHVFHRGLLS